MEHNMFCFQCEQTAGCSGCMGKAGVCGKTAATARIQDELTGTLIGLARASEGKDRSPEADRLIVKGLFATLTNVSFDDSALNELLAEAGRLKHSLSPMCGSCTADCSRTEDFDMNRLWSEDEDIRSLKSLILFGMRGMAAYAYHAMVLGHEDRGVMDYFYKGLSAVGYDSYTVQDLLPIVMELGAVNLDCMALLDRANRQAFGIPAPAQVSLTVEQGPFIVISGHDLHDLKLLLEQTQGRGDQHIHPRGNASRPRLPGAQKIQPSERQFRNRMAESAEGIFGPSRPCAFYHQLPDAAQALLL